MEPRIHDVHRCDTIDTGNHSPEMITKSAFYLDVNVCLCKKPWSNLENETTKKLGNFELRISMV